MNTVVAAMQLDAADQVVEPTYAAAHVGMCGERLRLDEEHREQHRPRVESEQHQRQQLGKLEQQHVDRMCGEVVEEIDRLGPVMHGMHVPQPSPRVTPPM